MTTIHDTTIATGGVRGGSCAGDETRGGSCARDETRGGSCAGDETDFDDGKYQPIDSFDDMGLNEALLRGIYTYGFERPSAIQQRAIRPLVDMKDLIAQAQSGTGKTACFTIGLLQNIDAKSRRCQAVVVAPTRELAIQHEKVANALGEYSGVSTLALIGGTSIKTSIDKLRAGVQLVVGTPGRVLDMMQRGRLDVSELNYIVLDEADEILSRGFEEQVYQLFQLVPREAHVALFSATMPPEMLALTSKLMSADAVRILVKREQQTLDGIRQYYVHVGQEANKFECLCDLYESLSITQAMIFVNTRRKVEWLTEHMHSRDFTVSAIHADLSQDERSLIIQSFRAGTARVLITTDVLARGIDVQQVNLVINYDLQTDISNYVHRIGRSGRFGRKGVAINFLTADDVSKAREIEGYYSTTIEELPRDVSDL